MQPCQEVVDDNMQKINDEACDRLQVTRNHLFISPNIRRTCQAARILAAERQESLQA